MPILDRFSLTGRIALVTGGAGPLFGRSISTALAEAGATVVTASRSRERNDQFAAEMQGRGSDVHGLAFDLLDPVSIDGLHDQVLQKLGRVDILVNSALAQQGHRGRFGDQTANDLQTVAQGDFAGLFRHCQRAVTAMKQQGGGSIINIASIYGVVSNDPGLYSGTEMVQPPSYNFVKAGMVNFTRYLACYFGRDGIRANCISPGGYFNNQPEAFVKRYSDRVPLNRMMGHEDLQGAVVFLASAASAYVTGTNLMVDGGWTCL
jgi:NAD(P)-dependent dehydrogenase (short-subunit alcohol dehydrogenase family)